MARPDGSERKRLEDEHVLELVIGKLLRICVIVTSAIVILGAVLYLPGAIHTTVSFGTFHGEPAAFRSVSGILRDAVTGDGKAIVQAGLLLLVLTPILRVAFSAVAFLHEKDYLYVALTLVVLALLMASLLGG